MNEPVEFVVTMARRDSGRVLRPFLVAVADETAARKLCQRNYLEIVSIEPYVERAGEKKPGELRFGPPVSDKDFEADYHHRPPEPMSELTKQGLMAAAIIGIVVIIRVVIWILTSPL